MVNCWTKIWERKIVEARWELGVVYVWGPLMRSCRLLRFQAEFLAAFKGLRTLKIESQALQYQVLNLFDVILDC